MEIINEVKQFHHVNFIKKNFYYIQNLKFHELSLHQIYHEIHLIGKIFNLSMNLLMLYDLMIRKPKCIVKYYFYRILQRIQKW